MFALALLPANEAEWIAARFADFAARLGPEYRQSRQLILPTRDFFNLPKGQDHATALAVLATVKHLMELGEDWPVRLIAQDTPPPDHMISDTTLIAHDAQPPLATFRIDENGPVITYDPNLLLEPQSFISTMAHELAHYIMSAYPSPEGPLPEPLLEEIATDLLTYFCGFGVLAVESAFSSVGYQDTFAQGWRIQNRGYISRETGAFALGLFIRLTGQESALALRHLGAQNRKLLGRALKQIDKNPALLDIAAGIDPQ